MIIPCTYSSPSGYFLVMPCYLKHSLCYPHWLFSKYFSPPFLLSSFLCSPIQIVNRRIRLESCSHVCDARIESTWAKEFVDPSSKDDIVAFWYNGARVPLLNIACEVRHGLLALGVVGLDARRRSVCLTIVQVVLAVVCNNAWPAGRARRQTCYCTYPVRRTRTVLYEELVVGRYAIIYKVLSFFPGRQTANICHECDQQHHSNLAQTSQANWSLLRLRTVYDTCVW